MYVNNLISLQENISTYGIDNGKVTGHVTLSSPGMIKCYVQNLKPSSSSNEYAFCVFSKHHNKGIKIGKLGTQKETKWLVDEKNIMGSGIKLEEIDGVALVAHHEMRGVETIAVGFSKDRYMLLSLMEHLFPRNEQKATQTTVKVMPPKPVQAQEKPMSTPEPKAPTPKPMPMPQPKVVEEGPGPVALPTPTPKPMPMPEPKVVEEGPGPVILPTPTPKPMPEPKVVEEGPGPVILPTPTPKPMPEPKVVEEGPGPVILPTPTPCEQYPKMQKEQEKEQEKSCGCRDFILPKDAKEGEWGKETNELPISEELKRIIDSISKDKRVEEKARELEKRIIEMNISSQGEKSFDKAQIQQAIESRYMSQKIDFEALVEEEIQDDLDTNPKKALDCINQMNLDENALDQEVLEERDYLKEIDKRLKAIKARMSEAIDQDKTE